MMTIFQFDCNKTDTGSTGNGQVTADGASSAPEDVAKQVLGSYRTAPSPGPICRKPTNWKNHCQNMS